MESCHHVSMACLTTPLSSCQSSSAPHRGPGVLFTTRFCNISPKNSKLFDKINILFPFQAKKEQR